MRFVQELGMYRNAFSKEGAAARRRSPFSHTHTCLSGLLGIATRRVPEAGCGIVALSLFLS